MISRFLLSLSLVLFISACGDPEPPPQKPVEYEAAKVISDAVAKDLLNDDIVDVYNRLDMGFKTIVKDANDVKKNLENGYIAPGRPLEFEFKISKIGTRVDGSWVRPCRTFWYAAKTKKFEKGTYFLKVEIVPAIGGGPLDVSGIGLLTFKEGKVPSYLQ